MILGTNAFILLAVVAAVSSKPADKKRYYKKDQFLHLEDNETGCRGKPAEVFFLLDTSASIWVVDFKKQIEFLSKVVDLFVIGPNAIRVGAATFSSTYIPEFSLNDNLEKELLMSDIKRIHYRPGYVTETGIALQRMRERGFSGAREGIPKIAIVMTDGRSRDGKKTEMEAALAKKENITIFAIGIGDKVDVSELKAIASHPSDQFVLQVERYDDLEKQLKNNLSLVSCAVEPLPLMQMDEPPVCSRDTRADVMFVFDSMAMGNKKTQVLQSYIGDVVGEFNFDGNLMRAGVVSRNCHDGDIYLGQHSDKEEFAKDLRNRDFPDMGHVIHKMRRHISKVQREEARRMAVIFVDSEVPKTAFDEVKNAKEDGIDIFVVAIGEDVNMDQVNAMATDRSYVIVIPDYDVMEDESMALVDILCAGL